MEKKYWDDITLVGEHHKIQPASKDEIRKVKNTLEKYNIDPSDIEHWKNNNWQRMEALVEECKQKEYSVMKRIVESEQKEKANLVKEMQNEREELETVKEVYNETEKKVD